MVKKNRIISNSVSDGTFDAVNILINAILLVIFMWPLWFMVVASLSDPYEVNSGNVVLWVKGFSLNGYRELLKYEPIWIGYRNTILYTALGTVINMVMTVLCAYPLSRKEWMARNFWLKFCLITMYFGGGLIPTYLVVKGLGLLDTIWAMMIPGALSFYNALIVRNYFMNSIPVDLFESAKLDGATHGQYLLKVALPLSKPVLSVVALYYAVGHWNDYYTALIYINDRKLIPLQSAMKDLMSSAQVLAAQITPLSSEGMMSVKAKMELAMSLKYTTIIASIIPMLIVYPLVQKHFVKGVMLGAIKG
jgi:putative aldouronate transport system permease protein